MTLNENTRRKTARLNYDTLVGTLVEHEVFDRLPFFIYFSDIAPIRGIYLINSGDKTVKTKY